MLHIFDRMDISLRGAGQRRMKSTVSLSSALVFFLASVFLELHNRTESRAGDGWDQLQCTSRRPKSYIRKSKSQCIQIPNKVRYYSILRLAARLSIYFLLAFYRSIQLLLSGAFDLASYRQKWAMIYSELSPDTIKRGLLRLIPAH